MKFYLIYKITNIINNKIYIGKHITDNIDDGYMGSGNIIKRAILKYGLDNFEKEILFNMDNENDLNIKEAEIVNAEFIKLKSNYNLMPGGQGGNTLILYSDEELHNSNLKKSNSTKVFWENLSSQERFERNQKGQKNTNQTEKGKKISSWRRTFFKNETIEEKFLRIKKAKEGANKVKKIKCIYCSKMFDPGNYTKHNGKCKYDPNSPNYNKFSIKKIYIVRNPNNEEIRIESNFRKRCDELGISAHILKKNIGFVVRNISQHTSKVTDKTKNTIGWSLIRIDEIKL